MSHRERIMTAIEHREPDLVPVMDLGIDPRLLEKITDTKLGGSSFFGGGAKKKPWEYSLREVMTLIKACKKLDFDAVNITDYGLTSKKYVPNFIDQDTFVDEWGMVYRVRRNSRISWPWWIGGTIETPEDLENWVPPDSNAPGRIEILERAIKEIGGEMAVMGYIHIAFQFAWQVRGGIDKFIKDIYYNPSFAKGLLEKVFRASYELGKIMMDAGVDIITIGDDYADSNGPILNPKLFREYEIPYLKRICNEAKRRGIPVLKHSDGNLTPILDDLLKAGISGLHPIEPGVMDISQVKKTYGNKIFLAGNVDCRNVLTDGSEEDVRKDVRRCIDAAAEGGGYILTSSNSLHSDVKVENIFTMVDEARKYGAYPKHACVTK